jgi:hypothetical protein
MAKAVTPVLAEKIPSDLSAFRHTQMSRDKGPFNFPFQSELKLPNELTTWAEITKYTCSTIIGFLLSTIYLPTSIAHRMLIAREPSSLRSMFKSARWDKDRKNLRELLVIIRQRIHSIPEHTIY